MKTIRKLAEIDNFHYVNPPEDMLRLVPMHLCECGVFYSATCPVWQHRENRTAEQDEVGELEKRLRKRFSHRRKI